jgi:hypothetical protein
MASPYDSLVDTGAIASLKRDILIEASDDIYYLAHIRGRFVEDAGAEAAKVATACTVRLITELVAKNLCFLATWGKEKGAFEMITKTDNELSELVDRYQSFSAMPFDFFLIATEAGNEWVARYRTLVAEL